MADKETIEVVIDGKTCTCERGEYLYDVAKRNDIFIPTLCRHDAFEHRGACRICIVEVTEHGRTRVVASCIYPITRPCEVATNSDRIKEERATILELLSARAPEASRILQMMSFYGAERPSEFVTLDGEKCILCGLCMQACEELGTGAISTVLRGTEKKVSTLYDRPAPTCVGCRSCAEVCPTDAIEWSQDDDASTRTIWHKTFELQRCERCGAVMGTRDEVAWAAERADQDAPTLCDACRKRALADGMVQAFGR